LSCPGGPSSAGLAAAGGGGVTGTTGGGVFVVGGAGGVAAECFGRVKFVAGFGRTVVAGVTGAIGACTSGEGCEVVCWGGAPRRTRGIAGA
jgi:hypothetical protein